MTNKRSLRFLAGLLLALAFSACDGSAGFTMEVADGEQFPGSGSGSAGDTSSLGVPVQASIGGQPLVKCGGLDQEVKLQRLNRTEYDNSVRDLLGDTTHPAAFFPADSVGESFDNEASLLSLSPALIDAYDLAAAKLVDTVWTADATKIGSSAKVRVCAPAAGNDVACASTMLGAFAHKAWRRPVAQIELDEMVAIYNAVRTSGDTFELGVKMALRTVLLSPSFLFREVAAPPGQPQGSALSDHALASRLSYVLWSSTPDTELLQLADDGTLHDEAVLEAQVRRMLADSKASALVQNFAGQWLGIRKTDSLVQSASLFPGLTSDVKKAMREEGELFVQAFFREDRSALELLDSDFTYVNDALASYYGMPLVGSATAQKVSTVGKPRGGLLSQGGLLGMNSLATRTSPVKRGKWVLGKLLCQEPPKPPPGVEALPPNPTAGTSLRAVAEAHRNNPSCAGCHTLMDPIGFAMENFDAAGKWRDSDNGAAIDASGELPGGKKFVGTSELAAVLASEPALPECISEFALSYGLGRSPKELEPELVKSLAERFAGKNHRLPELFVTLAKSPGFTHECVP